MHRNFWIFFPTRSPLSPLLKLFFVFLLHKIFVLTLSPLKPLHHHFFTLYRHPLFPSLQTPPHSPPHFILYLHPNPPPTLTFKMATTTKSSSNTSDFFFKKLLNHCATIAAQRSLLISFSGNRSNNYPNNHSKFLSIPLAFNCQHNNSTYFHHDPTKSGEPPMIYFPSPPNISWWTTQLTGEQLPQTKTKFE